LGNLLRIADPTLDIGSLWEIMILPTIQQSSNLNIRESEYPTIQQSDYPTIPFLRVFAPLRLIKDISPQRRRDAEFFFLLRVFAST
jgi:hypothetical protein